MVFNRTFEKIKNLKFEIVDKDKNFDYMIMNNRVVWDKENNTYDSKKVQTCFQKFSGEDLIIVLSDGREITIENISGATGASGDAYGLTGTSGDNPYAIFKEVLAGVTNHS